MVQTKIDQKVKCVIAYMQMAIHKNIGYKEMFNTVKETIKDKG